MRIFSSNSLDQTAAYQGLVLHDCFQEVLEKTAVEIIKCGIDWRVPGILRHSDAFDHRMKQHIESSSKQKINFNRIVSKFCKKNFPEYECERSIGDILLFKRLTNELEYFFIFEKQHLVSLGKAFSIVLGIRISKGPLASFELRENLFRLFYSHLEIPTWIYSNIVELDADLISAAHLLSLVAPLIEKILLENLHPLPTAYPEWIHQRGPVTAKEAFDEAWTFSKDWAPDMKLVIMTSGVALQDELGPGIEFDGRIKENGSWLVQFYSRQKKSYLRINLPFHGSLHSANSHYEIFNNDAIEGEWMDSDQAFHIAETKHGGKTARSNASVVWHVGCRLSRRNAENWEISYGMTDRNGERVDFTVRFDPITGDRFPDWY